MLCCYARSQGQLKSTASTVRPARDKAAYAGGLLINYDDERSAAGFQVLAELAQKTQVLFFTHHQHLAGLAKRALSPVEVPVTTLA